MVNIRIQFIREEFDRFLETGKCDLPILNQYSNQIIIGEIKGFISSLIDAHFQYSEIGRCGVFASYIKSCLGIIGIENDLIANLCADIFDGAIHGNFSHVKEIRKINSELHAINPRERGEIMPFIAFTKLCKSPILFNDLANIDGKKRLGIRAKIAIFGAILFERL